MEINPLLHVSAYPVEWKRTDNPKEEHPAYVVAPVYVGDPYIITLCDIPARSVYAASWVSRFVGYEDFFVPALTLHETGHILKESFSCKAASIFQANAFFKHLDNVIEDTRCEMQLIRDLPHYASYLRVLGLAYRKDANLSRVEVEKEHNKKRLENLLFAFYRLIRFGLRTDGVEDSFYEFLLPLALSSRRGGRENALHAAQAVYHYFQQEFLEDKGIAKTLYRAYQKEQSVGEQELEALAKEVSSEQTLLGNTSADFLQDMCKKKDKQESLFGKQAGTGKEHLKVEAGDTLFIRQTIEKRKEEIVEVHRALRKLFDGLSFLSVVEGDPDMRKQQEAWIAAHTGEEEMNDIIMHKRVSKADLLLCCDTSSSTSGIQHALAEACIVVHAAAEQIADVRSAQIDFSGLASYAKEFSEKTLSCRIAPRASGSTSFFAPLHLFLRGDVEHSPIEWKAEQKLCLVITDGEFLSRETYQALLDEAMEKGIRFFFLEVFDDARKTTQSVHECDIPFYHLSLAHLPEVIYALVAACVRGGTYAVS